MGRWTNEPILFPASPQLPRFLCIFCPKDRWIAVHFRKNDANQAHKPE
jgi:hypothetical protein